MSSGPWADHGSELFDVDFESWPSGAAQVEDCRAAYRTLGDELPDYRDGEYEVSTRKVNPWST